MKKDSNQKFYSVLYKMDSIRISIKPVQSRPNETAKKNDEKLLHFLHNLYYIYIVFVL